MLLSNSRFRSLRQSEFTSKSNHARGVEGSTRPISHNKVIGDKTKNRAALGSVDREQVILPGAPESSFIGQTVECGLQFGRPALLPSLHGNRGLLPSSPDLSLDLIVQILGSVLLPTMYQWLITLSAQSSRVQALVPFAELQWRPPGTARLNGEVTYLAFPVANLRTRLMVINSSKP